MPIDWDEEYRKAYRQNVTDTPGIARAGKMDRKINSFCALHGFTREEVLNAIEENRMVAAFFSINPSKQNLYEKIAARYISTLPGVTNFRVLPTNDLYIVDGEVKNHKSLRGAYPNSKSIDFVWEFNGYTCYASHKYTKEVGGAQGNQYKDLQRFLADANKVASPRTYFLAIADGQFYQYQNGKASTTRIQKLQQIANRQSVFACTCESLQPLLQNVCL